MVNASGNPPGAYKDQAMRYAGEWQHHNADDRGSARNGYQHPDAEGPSGSDACQLSPDQAPPGLRALLEAKAEGLSPGT